jgi:hypothetical protein
MKRVGWSDTCGVIYNDNGVMKYKGKFFDGVFKYTLDDAIWF